MTTIAQGRVSGLVAVRWNNTATVAIATDWFTDDLKPSQEARRRFALDDAFTVVKHSIQVFVPTSTIVNILLKFEGQDNQAQVAKTFPLNGGTALTAGVPFQFDLMLITGSSYNIQHATGTQNVAAFITESFNTDI